MKLYNESGDEVEAYTKEEVDAKTAELTKQVEETKASLEEKTSEFEKLNTRFEDKNTSYSELLKKNKEYEASDKERTEKITSDYAEAIKEKVKELAGDDKEYAKELTKHLEREGIKEVTNDAEKISQQIKEAKALTESALERQVVANPVGSGGEGPTAGNSGDNFTETAEGKSTYEALSSMQGTPVQQEDNK